MKNKAQIGIALGLMCVLLTSAIAVQLNTIKEATKIVGTPYAQSELREEVLREKDEYERLYKELEEKEEELERVRQETTKENTRLKELQQDLDNTNKLLGLTEVTGSGIILILRDNDGSKVKELSGDLNKALVHDVDLREIINELKNTGAEAISINGQRIIGGTAITCSGAIITLNGVKLNSPFEIRAIGNPNTLAGITRVGGYLAYMEDKGINAEFSGPTTVTVPKYTGVNNPKYMKNVE